MKSEKIDVLSVNPVIHLAILLIPFVVIGTCISFVVGKHFLSPVDALIQGTKEVAKGNFDIQIKANTSTNELKELIDHFNFMASELQNVDLIHNDFITNFSHEFSTPIASIKGFCKQLNNPTTSEEEKKESITIILEETERLSRLSENILLLTKIEKQQLLTSKKTTFSLDEQLRTCILLLQNLWEEKKITFSLELLPLSIVADEDLLTQAWLNLIKNAIRYSPKESTISVRCYIFGRDIKVLVKDQGIGMSDYVRNHIFDKFYQGDASHHTMGNGLGLTITKKIIELHHGKITVKSKLQQGTTFITTLPTGVLKDSLAE